MNADGKGSSPSSALLEVRGLEAEVDGKAVLKGVDLDVQPGSIHVLMGPNGAGKSVLNSVLAGLPEYHPTAGTCRFDGRDLLAMSVWQRAEAGLFLAYQSPQEVEGVSVAQILDASTRFAGESALTRPAEALPRYASSLRVSDDLWQTRGANVDASGGEKKRSEVLQLMVLKPRLALLDEIDSGLDVDGLRAVSDHIRAAITEWNMAALVITHYSKMLEFLRPDAVSVLKDGRIVESGGAELAARVVSGGFAA